MPLKEYLVDYASPETRAVGDTLISKELANIPNAKVRAVVSNHLAAIENGTGNDFRF